MTTTTTRAPRPVDLHVGARIRSRRRQLGLTQEALAEAVDLTFQQVQKYERGANRVSASMLWEIAQKLDIPVAWLFEGLPDQPRPPSPESDVLHQLGGTTWGLELARIYVELPSHTRASLLSVARILKDNFAGEIYPAEAPRKAS